MALAGCKTVYEGSVMRMHDKGRGKPGAVIAMPAQTDDTLRSSNYRFTASLTKSQLDRVMAAMDQYHLEMYRALGPDRKEHPEYADVVILDDEASFLKKIEDSPDAVVDRDFIAVIPSKRMLVLLHRGTWMEFSRRLFRSQARLFLRDFMPQLPAWLREGMISFFEEVTMGGLGGRSKFKIVGYSSEKLAGVHKLIKSGKLPGLKSISAITDRAKFTEADLLSAWAFVYWSQHSGRLSRETFKRFVGAIIEKGPENVDIGEYLRISLPDFEKRWKEWLLEQKVFLPKGKQESERGRKK